MGICNCRERNWQIISHHEKSSVMGHDKDGIYYYNNYILKDLIEKGVKFKKVHY